MQKELEIIKERNRRVEGDKAWERSLGRRLFIAAITYVTAGVWLVTIGDSNPWLTALVPTGGYLLSTLSLPPLKKWWIVRYKNDFMY